MADQLSILVVDDDYGLARTMAFVLRREGCLVTTANDGPGAIARARERPLDLVFLDIEMSGMNGVETYRRIKKIRPHAVVVMMTEDLIQEALAEGAYEILRKPLDMDEVAALIARVGEARQTLHTAGGLGGNGVAPGPASRPRPRMPSGGRWR